MSTPLGRRHFLRFGALAGAALVAAPGVRLRPAQRGRVRAERTRRDVGPETVFSAAPPVANTSPADGFQFFGHVAIDGHSRAMTVALRDLGGRVLFTQVLRPS